MNVIGLWFMLMDNPKTAEAYRQNPKAFIRAFWRIVRAAQRQEVAHAVTAE